MNDNLLQKLKDWRKDTAQKEGVDLFRVLQNITLESIVSLKPKTKEELMSIKGIRDRKFEKYGNNILELVNVTQKELKYTTDNLVRKGDIHEPLSVSQYLNLLNTQLAKLQVRIHGEISNLSIQERVIYFSLKDLENESVINCLMWKRDYQLSGIVFEIGVEVILEGYPEVYKSSGRLSFKVSSAELVGEGILKKAYEKLKKKLEVEGLFSELRKKQIPDFLQKIGLITSESGAVIHDFLNNLGKYGFQIKFKNSRVEGQGAIHDLISSINYFNNKDIDVLVIIRGGGSLESLQAFNNEALVRRIADFKSPVICGIGHDKDVTLLSLVVDKAVSTPTAVTTILNQSWEKVINDILAIEKDLVYKYQRILDLAIRQVELFSAKLIRFFSGIFQTFETLRHYIQNSLSKIAYELKGTRKTLLLFSGSLLNNLKMIFENSRKMLDDSERKLYTFDPSHQLQLGYSIISVSGKVIKTIKQVKIGEQLDVRVFDGKIKSIVSNINK